MTTRRSAGPLSLFVRRSRSLSRPSLCLFIALFSFCYAAIGGCSLALRCSPAVRTPPVDSLSACVSSSSLSPSAAPGGLSSPVAVRCSASSRALCSASAPRRSSALCCSHPHDGGTENAKEPRTRDLHALLLQAAAVEDSKVLLLLESAARLYANPESSRRLRERNRGRRRESRIKQGRTGRPDGNERRRAEQSDRALRARDTHFEDAFHPENAVLGLSPGDGHEVERPRVENETRTGGKGNATSTDSAPELPKGFLPLLFSRNARFANTGVPTVFRPLPPFLSLRRDRGRAGREDTEGKRDDAREDDCEGETEGAGDEDVPPFLHRLPPDALQKQLRERRKWKPPSAVRALLENPRVDQTGNEPNASFSVHSSSGSSPSSFASSCPSHAFSPACDASAVVASSVSSSSPELPGAASSLASAASEDRPSGRIRGRRGVGPRVIEATAILARVVKCESCSRGDSSQERWHAFPASGVFIHPSGILVTNFHVLDSSQDRADADGEQEGTAEPEGEREREEREEEEQEEEARGGKESGAQVVEKSQDTSGKMDQRRGGGETERWGGAFDKARGGADRRGTARQKSRHRKRSFTQREEMFIVMDRRGRCWPVQEVLAADEETDLALLKVDWDGLVDGASLSPSALPLFSPSVLTDVSARSPSSPSPSLGSYGRPRSGQLSPGLSRSPSTAREGPEDTVSLPFSREVQAPSDGAHGDARITPDRARHRLAGDEEARTDRGISDRRDEDRYWSGSRGDREVAWIPIARLPASEGTGVVVSSHPSGRFFSLSSGIVSRYFVSGRSGGDRGGHGQAPQTPRAHAALPRVGKKSPGGEGASNPSVCAFCAALRERPGAQAELQDRAERRNDARRRGENGEDGKRRRGSEGNRKRNASVETGAEGQEARRHCMFVTGVFRFGSTTHAASRFALFLRHCCGFLSARLASPRSRFVTAWICSRPPFTTVTPCGFHSRVPFGLLCLGPVLPCLRFHGFTSLFVPLVSCFVARLLWIFLGMRWRLSLSVSVLAVTADFARGSSGAPVSDAATGELLGIAQSTSSLYCGPGSEAPHGVDQGKGKRRKLSSGLPASWPAPSASQEAAENATANQSSAAFADAPRDHAGSWTGTRRLGNSDKAEREENGELGEPVACGYEGEGRRQRDGGRGRHGARQDAETREKKRHEGRRSGQAGCESRTLQMVVKTCIPSLYIFDLLEDS
ncbi:conserved hypothetical protein [Neospora caninum Liverpool]|uniref:Uncharacterized protein n=1 Tax=Neospora caninum (strain Liverpool) TaxID=572307 RepID=F0VLP9_NEOCL|nr:conserved hypothetical protein [Neospora caninum Liverpool]CBZ54177.1 conserved hypothetical protein [Neospora caninum Liverpool]CEL68878.1 TPA: hypothetical protein BN1204_046090 [Neospora caninum Liverpool]|eukprot:XP_003884208.1 conserved hypothetical protein [Neospora caninum Liverpool]